jgi:hypothetical protein
MAQEYKHTNHTRLIQNVRHLFSRRLKCLGVNYDVLLQRYTILETSSCVIFSLQNVFITMTGGMHTNSVNRLQSIRRIFHPTTRPTPS